MRSPAPVGTSLEEVTTPALVVDRRVLLENIASMATRAGAAGVQLWPHAKTHKSIEVAEMQRACGAAGLTVATVREAEAFAAAGFTNLLLTTPPVGLDRLQRIMALAETTQLRVVVDSQEAVLGLDQACARSGLEIPYLWEVDCGTHRFGTPSGETTARAVAGVLDRFHHCRFEGLLSFGGHAYGARTEEELISVARDESNAVTETALALAGLGVISRVGSIGTTPTAHFFEPVGGVTEMRPGNYVVYDATQVGLGVVDAERCALSVLATVVSRPSPDRAILDSGSKALAAERMSPRTRDFGFVLGRPEVRLERLYEEHGIAVLPPGSDLRIGGRVRVVPNHACAAVNLHERMLVVEGNEVVDVWPVYPRGWSARSGRAALVS